MVYTQIHPFRRRFWMVKRGGAVGICTPGRDFSKKSQKEVVWTVEVDSEIGGGPPLSAT